MMRVTFFFTPSIITYCLKFLFLFFKNKNKFRVPAHKHPQIAPSEFVNWIQVHGAAPTRKGSKVKRQKSQLSRSMSYNDPSTNDFDKESQSTASESDSPVSPHDPMGSGLLPMISENVTVDLQKNGKKKEKN
ncbi:hypothetical protein BDC45DRAFT_317275 [Circinella umbellata]|nr:hypothetical protein BDC45DRAFT_317275 [Circinella umbellata]